MTLRSFLLFACLGGGILSGCAGGADTRGAVALAITCDTYTVVLKNLTTMRAAGELSQANIDRVDNANRLVTPVCSTDSVLQPAEVIGTVTAAINLIKAVGDQ